jgi:hypothetical protein
MNKQVGITCTKVPMDAFSWTCNDGIVDEPIVYVNSGVQGEGDEDVGHGIAFALA